MTDPSTAAAEHVVGSLVEEVAAFHAGQGNRPDLRQAFRAARLFVPRFDDPARLGVRDAGEAGVWLCAYTSLEAMAIGEQVTEDGPDCLPLEIDGADLVDDVLPASAAFTGIFLDLGSPTPMTFPIADLTEHTEQDGSIAS